MTPSVRLLGSPAVQHKGNWHELPPGLPSALLYYLAYQGSWVSREQLAYLFWPDIPEARARRNLRNLVLRVKDLPYTDALGIERDRLRWQIATDIQAFHQTKTAEPFAATELFKGDLLAGFRLDNAFEFTDWLASERETLRREHSSLILAQLETLEAKQNYAEAAKALEPLRKADPFDEILLRQQLHYLKLNQQKSQALSVFEAFEALLQKEMGAAPEAETLHLVEEIRQAPVSLAEKARPAEPEKPSGLSKPFAKTDLPTQLTPFVGREAEKIRIAEQLADSACRLLTLLAPGGFGKTRLAIAAAEAQQTTFKDGVIFVGLADVSTAEQMLYVIADALDPSLLTAKNLKDNLMSFFASKELLLILDNLEQLSSQASLISSFLEAAPRLKVLATSRERLNLRAEWLMDLKGLRYPKNLGRDDPERSDAVSLFVQTAKRFTADFALDDATLAEVIKICQLVEGMPLALELAAGWLQVLDVRDIVSEIEQGLDLLESSTRDTPERHQSIRAVFDSSWAFLKPAEQTALRRLAVFQAGFSREAAQLVSQANLIILGSLMNKSFLSRSVTGRYFRHPLIYQYTQEKLADSDDLESIREKHARYFLERLQLWSKAFYEGKQTDILALLEADLANIRAAWRWALENKQFADLRSSCDLIEKFFIQSNRFQEGLEFFIITEQSLSEEASLLLTEVLVSQAGFHDRFGNNAEVARCSAQAYALAEEAKDTYWMAQSLNVQGIAAIHKGDYAAAQHYFEQALDLAHTQETKRVKARASNNLALTHLELGNYDKAAQLYQEAFELNKQLGNHLSRVKNLSNLGNLSMSMKHYDEAEDYFQQALALANDLNFQEPLQHVYSGLAMVTIELDDLSKAEAFAQEALRLALKSGERNIEVEALRSLAKISALQGDEEKTNKLLLKAIQLAWEVSALPYLQDVLVDLAELKIKQKDVGLAQRILKLAEHHKATSQATKEKAQQLLKTIGFLEQSKTLRLEQIIASILADSGPVERAK